MDMLHATQVMAIFVIFWPILAKISLPWQHPLRPLQSEMSYFDWSTPKTSVISNCILVVSRRNAFMISLFVQGQKVQKNKVKNKRTRNSATKKLQNYSNSSKSNKLLT